MLMRFKAVVRLNVPRPCRQVLYIFFPKQSIFLRKSVKCVSKLHSKSEQVKNIKQQDIEFSRLEAAFCHTTGCHSIV